MLRNVMILVIVCISFNTATPVTLAKYNFLQDSSLKVTIETEEIIYEWEYENPDQFEYEEGDSIFRGEKAKDSFEKMLMMIDLTEPKISDEVANKVNNEYNMLERITIKKIDADQYMQTWVWNSTK
ncbi:hypothetical protein ACM26V_11145 [Salipaludibacillus sp. HK11]|uniref:hypothetical protein n=1 Tax=Salipaludibacillus sp. HK11 TaxID=3394320 RepID=UPI0039FBD417